MTCEDDRHVAIGKDGGTDLDQAAYHAPEINRHPRFRYQVGGRFVEAARRGDEPVEPVERAFDKAYGPLRPLIVLRQGAAQWLDRLANNRDWRLEGVGIVLGRLPDVGGGAVQGLDHPVKLGGDVGQFGKVVAVSERSCVRSLLANAASAQCK